jgi:hypothetical protein
MEVKNLGLSQVLFSLNGQVPLAQADRLSGSSRAHGPGHHRSCQLSVVSSQPFLTDN